MISPQCSRRHPEMVSHVARVTSQHWVVGILGEFTQTIRCTLLVFFFFGCRCFRVTYFKVLLSSLNGGKKFVTFWNTALQTSPTFALEHNVFHTPKRRGSRVKFAFYSAPITCHTGGRTPRSCSAAFNEV